MNLKQRIERMEKRFHSGIAATLTGWYESLDSTDPELRLGVDDKGQALISPYWSIWFLETIHESSSFNSASLGGHDWSA